jgi:hypothetical protein
MKNLDLFVQNHFWLEGTLKTMAPSDFTLSEPTISNFWAPLLKLFERCRAARAYDRFSKIISKICPLISIKFKSQKI